MTTTTVNGNTIGTQPIVLDWRSHCIGTAEPCRLCGRPAICRDENGRPCHKVCAEQRLADSPDTQGADR